MLKIISDMFLLLVVLSRNSGLEFINLGASVLYHVNLNYF